MLTSVEVQPLSFGELNFLTLGKKALDPVEAMFDAVADEIAELFGLNVAV